MVGIYKITSPSGRVYIGQSWNIEQRFSSYKRNDCKYQRILLKSFIKYGYHNHKIEVTHELPADVSQDVLDAYEIFYWERYKECGFKMMNIREPGKNGRHSDETKRRIGLAHIGNKHNLGKPLSEETKKKIGKAHKGKIMSAESRRKMSEYKKGKPALNKGTKHTEESKRKMSAWHTGRPSSRKGKSPSDESRKKMSISQKKRFENNPPIWKKGSKFSAEHRKKLSDAKIGKPSPNKGAGMSKEEARLRHNELNRKYRLEKKLKISLSII